MHGVGGFPQIKAGWGLGVHPGQCCHFTDGETEADFSYLVVGWGALDIAWPLEASQSRTSSTSLVRQRQTMEKGIQAKGAACAGAPSCSSAWSIGSRRAAQPGRAPWPLPRASLQKGAQKGK